MDRDGRPAPAALPGQGEVKVIRQMAMGSKLWLFRWLDEGRGRVISDRERCQVADLDRGNVANPPLQSQSNYKNYLNGRVHAPEV